jgi:hypothetical protein
MDLHQENQFYMASNQSLCDKLNNLEEQAAVSHPGNSAATARRSLKREDGMTPATEDTRILNPRPPKEESSHRSGMHGSQRQKSQLNVQKAKSSTQQSATDSAVIDLSLENEVDHQAIAAMTTEEEVIAAVDTTPQEHVNNTL